MEALELVLADELISKIIDEAVKCFEEAKLNVIHYKKFEKTDDGFASFETKEKITIGFCHESVYGIFELDDDENQSKLLYIGSTKTPTKRLKEHLIKNNDVKLDGTFVDKKIPCRSKIACVYNLLKGKKKKCIGYKIIKIKNNKIYTAIESLLIEHYDLIDSGWNERE